MSEESLPKIVLRLLELLADTNGVYWQGIPKELRRDAWRIAYNRDLIATYPIVYRGAERHEAYRESLNMPFFLTEKGRDALALHRAKQAVAGRGKEAEHEPHATKTKRSTTRGSARAKIIGYLNKHHKYTDGAVLNKEPIQCNELARKADVANASASRFFEKYFGGHEKYMAMCRRNSADLETSLKLLNVDFPPHLLYGRTPPGELQSDAE
jgi:hypothetical protein